MREPEYSKEEDEAQEVTGSELLLAVGSGRGRDKGSGSRLEEEIVMSFPFQATGDGDAVPCVPVEVPADAVPVVPVESASQAQTNQGYESIACDGGLALVQAVETSVTRAALPISLGIMLSSW